MYQIEASNRFKKEYKLAIKRGLKRILIDEVIFLLEKNGKLPAKYKPHVLKGNFKSYWGVPHTTRLAFNLEIRRNH